MKRKEILTFGNPVYDVIYTPFCQRLERVLSGCSTNACLAVAKLGEHATLVGTIGPDYRDQIQKECQALDIQTQLYPSAQSGGFSLIYDERGNRELSILGVADAIPENVDGFHAADFILIGPILGETPSELVKNLKASQPAPILFDPQGALRRLKDHGVVHEITDQFVEIARLSTVVKANELETLVITGIDPRQDPEKAVKALWECGCQIAIVTLAEAGSIIYDGQTIYPIPPFEVNAIDPTGAGDTYAAGFMVKYLEAPQDLTAVGCFASAVSSVMVENSGPDFPLTRAEADRRQAALLAGPIQIKLSA